MPQMSPLLWALMIIYSISLLLIISSFLYFMTMPLLTASSSHARLYFSPYLSMFSWLW